MKSALVSIVVQVCSATLCFGVNNDPPSATFDRELSGLSAELGDSLDSEHLKTVAVVNFTDLDGNEIDLGKLVAEDIAENLVNQKNNVSVVDLATLHSIIRKQNISGETNDGTAKPNLTSIDATITGKIIPFDNAYRVEVTVIAADTAKIIIAKRATLTKTPNLDLLMGEQTESSETILDTDSPIPTQGLSLWLMAGVGVKTTEGGHVAQWKDQSPNHNNAYQSIVQNQPVRVAKGFNNRPIIRLNGTAFMNTDHVATSDQDYSFFIVGTIGVIDSGFYNGDTSNNGWGLRRHQNPTSYQIMDGGTDYMQFCPIQNPNDVQLLSATRGSGMTSFYVYGAPSGTGNLNMSNPTGTAHIGPATPDSPLNPFTADIAEIIVYNCKLSDEDRQKIESYLANKYDLKLSSSPQKPHPTRDDDLDE